MRFVGSHVLHRRLGDSGCWGDHQPVPGVDLGFGEKFAMPSVPGA
jgi:hypothetical protein